MIAYQPASAILQKDDFADQKDDSRANFRAGCLGGAVLTTPTGPIVPRAGLRSSAAPQSAAKTEPSSRCYRRACRPVSQGPGLLRTGISLVLLTGWYLIDGRRAYPCPSAQASLSGPISGPCLWLCLRSRGLFRPCASPGPCRGSCPRDSVSSVPRYLPSAFAAVCL